MNSETILSNEAAAAVHPTRTDIIAGLVSALVNPLRSPILLGIFGNLFHCHGRCNDRGLVYPG
jgi:hypothetical protein